MSNTKRSRSLKLRLTAAALLTGLTLASFPTQANLQSSMNNIFNSMSNFTRPGVHESIRRGIVSGGSATIRNKIVDINLLSFQPPSIMAGCAGIDLFGGSFSFINSEQLVQVMRAIAANALTYAFKLALRGLCEKCVATLDELQGLVQEINNLLSNSCQAAQSIVESVASMDFSAGGQAMSRIKDRMGRVATAAGFGTDELENKQTRNSIADAKNANAPEYNELVGNTVFKALAKQDASSWFIGASSTNKRELYEQLMSITGTVVITFDESKMDPGKENEQSEPDYKPWKGILGLKGILQGGDNLPVYECTSANFDDLSKTCLELKEKKISLDNLVQKLRKVYLGDSYVTGSATTIGGLIKKLHDGTELTAVEQNISSINPLDGVTLFELARNNQYLAAVYVDETIESLALDYVWRLVQDNIRVVQSSLTKSKNSESANNALKLIRDREDELHREYQTLKQIQPTTLQKIQLRKQIMETFGKTDPTIEVPALGPNS